MFAGERRAASGKLGDDRGSRGFLSSYHRAAGQSRWAGGGGGRRGRDREVTDIRERANGTALSVSTRQENFSETFGLDNSARLALIFTTRYFDISPRFAIAIFPFSFCRYFYFPRDSATINLTRAVVDVSSSNYATLMTVPRHRYSQSFFLFLFLYLIYFFYIGIFDSFENCGTVLFFLFQPSNLV